MGRRQHACWEGQVAWCLDGIWQSWCLDGIWQSWCLDGIFGRAVGKAEMWERHICGEHLTALLPAVAAHRC